MECCPLVSVPVVTYNSSKTVVETLDSICNQTYPKLELIISDDGSTDDTVETCRNWIAAHKDRFVRVELLTVERNTGVSANMNRAERACCGDWVKVIAGDDLLLDDCIETYVDYVNTHPDAVYIFASMAFFGGDEEERASKRNWYEEHTKPFFESSIEEQYDFLTMVGCCIPAPTAFFNKTTMETLGIVNDERIPYLEDVPKWINLLKKQVRFHYIDKETVGYRMRNTSLCRKTPEKFDKSKAKLYVYYCFENDYKKGDKKIARLKWLRAQRTIHDNGVVWKGLAWAYKKVYHLD